MKMFSKMVKGLNWLLSNIVTIEMYYFKKGGAYAAVEKLKFFGMTVDKEEYFIKDVVIDTLEEK